MKTILSIEEAVKLVPAIGAQRPIDSASDKYEFVSTKKILEHVETMGWRITNATSQGNGAFSQHRVTLVHDNYINCLCTNETIPRIELFNSHNKTKRLTFAIGLLRQICSNGLIVATGPAESIRSKHQIYSKSEISISEYVCNAVNRFPVVLNTIESFKQRKLTKSEQKTFAEYAIKGRYNYRPQIPKLYTDLDYSANKILQTRRKEDEGDSLWVVYNRVQENLIKGIEGFNRPVNSYSDNIRTNQLLWKGAETALDFTEKQFQTRLTGLLIKDGTKGKIAAG